MESRYSFTPHYTALRVMRAVIRVTRQADGRHRDRAATAVRRVFYSASHARVMHVTATEASPCERDGSEKIRSVPMTAQDSTEYIQKEHLEILRLADKIADALVLASREDLESRLKGLMELRSAEHGLHGVRQHCGTEDGILETDFHHFLDPDLYLRLCTQHNVIARLVNIVLKELPYATADSVSELREPCQELLDQLHDHIAFEQDMLWRVESRRLQYQ